MGRLYSHRVSIISYPTRARGIILNYNRHVYPQICFRELSLYKTHQEVQNRKVAIRIQFVTNFLDERTTGKKVRFSGLQLLRSNYSLIKPNNLVRLHFITKCRDHQKPFCPVFQQQISSIHMSLGLSFRVEGLLACSMILFP